MESQLYCTGRVYPTDLYVIFFLCVHFIVILQQISLFCSIACSVRRIQNFSSFFRLPVAIIFPHSSLKTYETPFFSRYPRPPSSLPFKLGVHMDHFGITAPYICWIRNIWFSFFLIFFITALYSWNVTSHVIEGVEESKYSNLRGACHDALLQNQRSFIFF